MELERNTLEIMQMNSACSDSSIISVQTRICLRIRNKQINK